MGLLLRRRDDAAAKDGSLDAQSARDLTAGPGFNDILTSVRPTQAAGPVARGEMTERAPNQLKWQKFVTSTERS